MELNWRKAIHYGPVVQVLLIAVVIILAQWAGASGFEWESGAEKIKNSLLGPVALAIVIVGIIGLGAAMYFRGSDWSDMFSGVMRIAFIILLILGAAQWVTKLWTGASPAGVLLGG